MPTPSLHLLFVGINDYIKCKPLNGCVNDSNNLKEFIKKQYIDTAFLKGEEIVLQNSAATKSKIVAAFKQIAQAAKPGDSVFFAYSGHGTRENSDIVPFVRNEQDGIIECMVCHESESDYLLADKELRYLFSFLKDPSVQLFTLFDCCHSGDNTRGDESLEMPTSADDKKGICRKIVLQGNKAREWKSFIFSEKYPTAAQVQAMDLEEMLPLRKHFHISACRDVELAWEYGGKGALTSAVIAVLTEQKGNISYVDLQHRLVNQLFRKDEKNQTPYVTVVEGTTADYHRRFLTNEVKGAPVRALLTFNAATQEWRIPLGAMQGMIEKQEIEVKEGEAVVGKFAVKSVQLAYSVLQENGKLSQGKNYHSTVKVIIPPTKVWVETADLQAELTKTKEDSIQWVKTETEARYVIRKKNEKYRLTASGLQNPLLSDLEAFPSPATQYLKWLTQIAKWNFLYELCSPENTATRFDKDPIKVKIFQTNAADLEGVGKEIDCTRDSVILNSTDKINGFTPCTYYRLEVHNQTAQELFVSVLMLSPIFGVVNNVLDKQGSVLALPTNAPLKNRLMRNKSFLPFGQDFWVVKDKLPASQVWLKILVSTAPFTVQDLAMEDLPAPYSDNNRGMIMDEEDYEATQMGDKWYVRTILVEMPRKDV